MLEITSQKIIANGGLLMALRHESYNYLQQLTRSKGRYKKVPVNIRHLDRTIVHTHPHLDEYFADLILRSALPTVKMNIEFKELSIQSADNDSLCKAYFPNAIVLGIGARTAGGAKALKVYDEHLERGTRLDQSCSQMVSNTIFYKIPYSIQKVLDEVNQIDALGGAHPQHIGNIIKATHQVRATFKKGITYRDSIKDWIPTQWKKTIMDAAITAIIYCLEHKINLLEYTPEHDTTLRRSLAHFQTHCPYTRDANFTKTINTIRNIYLNQKVAYREARLPQKSQWSQLLLLSRVCYALHSCWGDHIAQLIMTNLWESIYQSQLIFNAFTLELEQLNATQNYTEQLSEYGVIKRQHLTLPHIKAEKTSKNLKTSISPNDLWIFEINPTPRLITSNRPLINFLNKHNNGFGLILINDHFSCTKSIFKGTSFPYTYWKKLVDQLIQLEPNSWFKMENEQTKKYTGFVLNGNPAHQYVPVSQIELGDLIALLKKL